MPLPCITGALLVTLPPPALPNAIMTDKYEHDHVEAGP